MSVEIFRFPRRRPLLIFCLAGMFVLGLALGQISLSGTVFVALSALVIAAIEATEWRYAVLVREASIEVGPFFRLQYELPKTKSISVRRVKGGRTGTVEFQGGETLALDGGIERFDELLALISSRTSLPITKPVWEMSTRGCQTSTFASTLLGSSRSGSSNCTFAPDPERISRRPAKGKSFMPKSRTDLELAIGKLIVGVQRAWNEEAGLPEADETLSVMYRCHDLLQAAKAGSLAKLLRGRAVVGYIGGLWLGTHPDVAPAVDMVLAAMPSDCKQWP